MATKTFTLLLTPADVSLFREPRPFQPGDTSLVSTLPNPQATAGAIRTWLLEATGVNLTKLDKSKPIDQAIIALCPAAEWIVNAMLRGPLLCYRNGSALFPAPQHLLGEEDEDSFKPLGFMRPCHEMLPGVSRPQGAPDSFRPAWLPTGVNGEPTNRYLNTATMTQVLADKKPPAKELIHPQDYFDFERRLGIGMNSDKNTREETRLYSAGFLRVDERSVCFRVDIEIDAANETELQDVVKRCPWLLWGGEKKAASVEIAASSPDLPRAPVVWDRSEEILFTTYLATPGLFEGGKWLPQKLMKTFELVSAVVGSPLAWSAWSRVTNQPGPTRYAVQTEAVYFWRKPKDVTADDPHGTCISDDPADAQAGWGLCLRGAWTYAK